MKSKLWVDDVRRPPNNTWDWARTFAAARDAMEAIHYDMVSLDHDLGGGHLDLDDRTDWDHVAIAGDETGLDVLDWMIREGVVPDWLRIHTMNSVGAQRMKLTFDAAQRRGFIAPDSECRYLPFNPQERG